MNPPHIGHILTLLRIKDRYDKIIVAISDYNFEGKKSHVMTVDEVFTCLHEILKYFPNFEIIIHKEPFRKRINFDDLPKFDIVITGSKEVYNNVVKRGLKAKLIKRIPVYRGEFIREAYLKGLEYDLNKSRKQGKISNVAKKICITSK